MLARRTQAFTHFTVAYASDQTSSVEPDDHYPLTCTPENGVWMLRFLPLPGSKAKSSNLMMFYEGKKSMQEGHTSELSIILFILNYIELY